jgi:hypothetical protein
MGAIPIHPKFIGRVLENRMGDSERIAEEYPAIEWTGCVIEPRNSVFSCG